MGLPSSTHHVSGWPMCRLVTLGGDADITTGYLACVTVEVWLEGTLLEPPIVVD